jgi:8-oxo-dGTP pyrophosphatase MutT (NUDIX family)
MTQPNRHSVSVAAVITNDDGQVLVTQRRDNGNWEFPGGILELDESIHDGLRREVEEETGLKVEPTRLTGIYKNMKVGVVALVFRATVVDGLPGPTEESAAVAWWTRDEVAARMAPVQAVRILDALDDLPTPAVRQHDGTAVGPS